MRSPCRLPPLSLLRYGSLDQRREVDHRPLRCIVRHIQRDAISTIPVVRAFQDGAAPETIVQRYSTLALPDVYAVLAYYLRHPNEVEEYLARREQKAEEVRPRIESQQGDLSEILARLLTQRRA